MLRYLDGTILHTNENFPNAMGSTLDKMRGKRHSMFVNSVDIDPKRTLGGQGLAESIVGNCQWTR